MNTYICPLSYNNGLNEDAKVLDQLHRSKFNEQSDGGVL